MRRVAVFFIAVALAALAARVGSAQSTVNYCEYIDTSESGFGFPGPNTTDPNATTEGSVWINTGGTLSLLSQDVNVQLIVDSPTLGWTPLIGSPVNGAPTSAGTPTTSTLLLSGAYDSYTGGSSALGDITDFPDQGIYDCNGTAYVVPGATDAGPFQFQLLTWTGTQYTTYAAAVGKPGTYTGRSAVFAESACYSINPPFPNFGWLNNSPAFTMQPQLPGDAVGDGKVDINDLTIVLAHYNQSGVNWNEGDFTGDGKVDINDLTIVLAHYNQSVSSAGPAGVGAVPEPGALALLALGLTALLPWALRR
jgi:hypothetical protein